MIKLTYYFFGLIRAEDGHNEDPLSYPIVECCSSKSFWLKFQVITDEVSSNVEHRGMLKLAKVYRC